MNIIIAGAGQVGTALARQLSAESHSVTLIDGNMQVLETCQNDFDVMSVQGNCAAMDVLLQAGVKDADLLIAATNADEINLLCCTTAYGINGNLHTIARIRNPEYTEQIYAMRHIFGLSMIINPEKQAAKEQKKAQKQEEKLRKEQEKAAKKAEKAAQEEQPVEEPSEEIVPEAEAEDSEQEQMEAEDSEQEQMEGEVNEDA